MKARLLDMGMVSPLRSQSIFHAVTQCMQPDSDVAITLMRPKQRYVSIGYFQEAEREVDLAFCEREGIPVFRRQVGGGAVLLDQNQLFVHLILPAARAREYGLPGSLTERFDYLARPAIAAYQALGVQAAFKPINDIHVSGRKIGGTGVGEIEDGLVFAGSMMLDFDTDLMAQVLRIPDEKMRDKVRQTLGDYMTTLRKELGAAPPVAEVAEALLQAFQMEHGVEVIPSMPTPAEIAAMAEWDQRLVDPEWLHAVRLPEPAVRDVKISAEVHVLQAQHKAPGGMIRATVRVVSGRVESVLLSGDIPVTPQSALTDLAQRFTDAPWQLPELDKRVEAAFGSGAFEMAGVQPADFSSLFQQIAR